MQNQSCLHSKSVKETKKVHVGSEVGGKAVPSDRQSTKTADIDKIDRHEEHQEKEQHELHQQIVKGRKKNSIQHKSRRVRQLYVCPLVSAFPGIIGPSLPCLYRIKCIIGQGSYSTVWALIDNSTEQMVVGKLSNITQESLHYVRGEAANMHLCKHFPFIVQHYKTYERHGRLLHILEYVDGGDLLLQVQARRKAMEEYKRVANESSTPVNAKSQTKKEANDSPLQTIAVNETTAATDKNETMHTNNMTITNDNDANADSTITNNDLEAENTANNNNDNNNDKSANSFRVKTMSKAKDSDTVSTRHVFVPITSTSVAAAITLPEVFHDDNVRCNDNNSQLTRRSFSFRQQKVYEKQLEKNRLKAEIDSANIKAFYFDETEILIILAQMCLALDYLHQHRIIHHDLKTSNVMVVANGLVKIGDFGFSRRYDANVEGPEAVASVCCGTPSYLAPEIWHNHKYNGKVDIWALGVIMYELMALQKPFQALTWDQLRLQVLKSGMNGKNQVECKLSGSAYSEELISLVCSMLTLDADQRPTASQILCSSLLERRALPLLRDHVKRLRTITDDLRANILHVIDTAPS